MDRHIGVLNTINIFFENMHTKVVIISYAQKFAMAYMHVLTPYKQAEKEFTG